MSDVFEDWQDQSLARILVSRARRWWRGLGGPDPWPEEVDHDVRSPEAVPVCHRCFLPLEDGAHWWFCKDCGAAVGPYNNVLPYVRVFSVGEVLRSGVGPAAPLTALSVCGYVIGFYFQFWILYPFYLVRLCRNIARKKKSAEADGEDAMAKRYSRLLNLAVILSALLFIVTGLTLWPNAVEYKAVSIDLNLGGF